MSLLIIADDLSGAADCAIGFASAGRSTVVTLASGAATSGAAHTAQILAADTDTRRLTPPEAAQRSVEAWQALHAPGRRLYKKIDSTLRGNWAAEVAALQSLAGLAIVAPAFPATGRTLRAGRVLVHGAPLETTETWQLEGLDKPADVSAMLEAAGLRTAQIDVAAVRGAPDALHQRIVALSRDGIQALIVDAETSEDLLALAQVTAAVTEPLFWVASGGLARELATLHALFDAVPGRVESAAEPAQQGAILILVGSLSAVSERQCAMLRERAGVEEMIVPPALLRAGRSDRNWAIWQARIGAQLEASADLLLRIGRDDAFDPAQGAQLSTALAALVAPHFAHVAGLIATGGETARAMLSEAGIDSLELLAEIEAGVAVARPCRSPSELHREPHGLSHDPSHDSSHDAAPRSSHRPAVVTKAGAFGTEHALYAAYLHLRKNAGKVMDQPAGTSE
ncbi:four-carbon acid sugar kinase family protein [Burkholderia sp. L27(2015)]|uniref:four-carbon acid sugar kinase family protein n=1 Tax=Burkholderia sp. L27(2015) TaxID=1641858 RepID=UPI00131C21DA|nr:four-carbon acid sugar kinase family protein [Burkholderia sp. L27(2015)]